ADRARGYRSHPAPPQRHAIGHAASAVVWGKFLDFLGAGLRGPRSAGILRGCPSFRAFRETAGTFSKPRRGGCPHPPAWGLFPKPRRGGSPPPPRRGLFSRSPSESALTYLSFRAAPRGYSAFEDLLIPIHLPARAS